MTADEVTRLIEAALSDARVSVLTDDETHFEAVVVGIIFLSILPMIITWLRHRFSGKSQ